MTNEWIDWSGENRVRTPLRGGGCNNFLNNNYTNQKVIFGMGLKANTLMKSTQRPKGKRQIFFGWHLLHSHIHKNRTEKIPTRDE